jgi:hypothetical protein
MLYNLYLEYTITLQDSFRNRGMRTQKHLTPRCINVLSVTPYTFNEFSLHLRTTNIILSTKFINVSTYDIRRRTLLPHSHPASHDHE